MDVRDLLYIRRCKGRPLTQEELEFLSWHDASDMDLRGIDCSGMDMTDYFLDGGDFDYSNFSGVTLHLLCGAGLKGCCFEGADLEECDFQSCEAEKAHFEKANMAYCFLSCVNLEKASFRDATLRNGKIEDCNLYGADLRNADMRGCDLQNTCWPLSRRSYGVRADRRIFSQLAHHLCQLVVEDEECKAAQDALRKLASEFEYTYEDWPPLTDD